MRDGSVDNMAVASPWWLGLVVPKRYARHAVTRNLIKRQMRAQATGNQHRLQPGQWLVRLRAPIDLRLFTSAASERLRSAMRDELALAFEKAARS